MTTIHCPHCGIANRVGSNFCNRCGTDLRAGEATASTRPEQPSTGSPSSVEDVASSTSSAAQTTSSKEVQNSTPGAEPAATFVTPSTIDPTTSQPWLQDETLFAPTEPLDPISEAVPTLATTGRLIAGVQGLLDPLRISSETDESGEADARACHVAPGIDLELDQLRHLRGLMTQDPTLLNASPLYRQPELPVLRVPWIFGLVGLMVALPIFLLFGQPVGQVQQWPGVAAAHATVESLAPNASVLILWAYDPTTADEMDLLALPLVAQLFARQSQPIVVSLLPNGLATARRLFARATADMSGGPTLQAQADHARYIEGGFLAGGAAVLPLLGQNLQAGLIESTTGASPALVNALAQQPALAVVVAAQAEDVQQWLELVQPLDQTPVVAFTSAGADAPLRPYLDSGQLRGLVSGFDGAYAYQQLLTRSLSVDEEAVYRRQQVFQNWGHLSFLLLIVLGNLAALIYPRA